MHPAVRLTGRSVAVTALSWGSLTLPARAQDARCETLRGTFETAPVLECKDSPLGVCVRGRLEGDLHGDYMFAFTRVDASMNAEGQRDFEGFSVIVTEGGALRTADRGQVDAGGMMMDDVGYMASGVATEATGAFCGKRVTLMVRGGLAPTGTKGAYQAMVCEAGAADAEPSASQAASPSPDVCTPG